MTTHSSPESAIAVEFTVNGIRKSVAVEPRTLLATVLREQLGLTGTHIGCDTSQCGCCTVLLNGDAIKSCTMLAVQADACEVQTIEGLSTQGELHPMQQAFAKHHALQCGFCTPGMIMSTVDIVRKHDDLNAAKVRHLIEGNICRCTGYMNIVSAVLDVSAQAKAASKEGA